MVILLFYLIFNMSNSFITTNMYLPNSIHINFINANRKAESLLNIAAKGINLLISKPVITLNANNIVITIGYYQLSNIIINTSSLNAVFNINVVNALSDQLSLVYNIPVNLQFIHQQYVYSDAYILAAYLSKLFAKNKFKPTINKVFKSINLFKSNSTLALPAWPIGIKVIVSGRLVTEVARPRKTVITASKGSIVKQANYNITVQTGSNTTSNAKGAITVKVWLAQKHSF